MKAIRRISTHCGPVLLVLVLAAVSQPTAANAADSECELKAETPVAVYVGCRLEAVSTPARKAEEAEREKKVDAATSHAKTATDQLAAVQANAESATNGSKLDKLKLIATALDLGKFQDDNGALTFYFNPRVLEFAGGRLSPKVVIHKPALDDNLKKAIDKSNSLDAGARSALEDRLTSAFDDLDDVEYSLRWVSRSRNEGRAKELAGSLLQGALGQPTAAEFLVGKVGEWRQLGLTENEGPGVTLGRLAELGVPQPHLVEEVDEYIHGADEELKALDKKLEGNHFDELAPLLDNDPTMAIESSFRDRSSAVGPDLGAATLRWEVGPVSYSSFVRWAKPRGGPSVDTLDEYLAGAGSWKTMEPRFALSLEYGESRPVHFLDATTGFRYEAEKAHRWTGKVAFGAFVNGPASKIDLDVQYHDWTGDPMRQNRLVGTATWTQKLSEDVAKLAGGSSFAVSFVWANRPEYRGTVNHAFGVHAGLKWGLSK